MEDAATRSQLPDTQAEARPDWDAGKSLLSGSREQLMVQTGSDRNTSWSRSAWVKGGVTSTCTQGSVSTSSGGPETFRSNSQS